jgi:hypothetical protein
MTVEELINALKKLGEAAQNENVYMWPADIANMQLVEEVEADVFLAGIVLS